MKRRTLTWFIATPVLLAATGLLSWWWLMHSESGARWVMGQAATATGDSLAIDTVSGNLSSGLKLTGISFEDGGIQATAERILAAIDIDLLPFALNVTTLQVDTVRLLLKDNPENKSPGENSAGSFAMPFPLTFRGVRISGIEYRDSSGEPIVVVNSIEGAGSLNEALLLDRLSIKLPENGLELTGQVTLAAPHPLDLKFNTSGNYELEGSIKGDLGSADLVLRR